MGARQAHFLCMGAENYELMKTFGEECAAEDAEDLVKYENMVLEKAGTAEPADLDDSNQSFLDIVRGYVAQKFCVYQVRTTCAGFQ